MQVISDFFLDSLVVPAYTYIAAYGFVWLIALGLGQLLKNQGSIEQAAKIAWGIALVMHILGGTVLIIWLSGHAHHRFSDWWYTPLYLLYYIVILIVDVCLLFSLLFKNLKKRNANASAPKPARTPLNPKKN